MEFMASGNDMKAHRETYEGFLRFVTWGVGICAVVVAIVVSLIAS